MDVESNFLEESDQDGYCKPKRRKVNEMGEFIKSSASRSSIPRVRKFRESPILQMPPEIHIQIFKYIPFNELGKKVRLVCKTFLNTINDIFNDELWSIGRKLKIAYKRELAAMSVTNNMADDAIKKCCKVVKILEICMHQEPTIENFKINIENGLISNATPGIIAMYSLLKQHNLIRTALWRYITEDYHSFDYKYCFYGGKVLDIFNSILRNVYLNPTRLYYQSRQKEHKLPKVVNELHANVKKFIIYFERIIEPDIPNLNDIYGAKMVDILDDSRFADRIILKDNVKEDMCDYEVVYVFRNAWFTALDISKSQEETNPREEQRLMCMRLRRITSVHTDMGMELGQWNREVSKRTQITHIIKPPLSSQYSGYGDYGDKFFFYGVMNEGAYIHKFLNDPEIRNTRRSLGERLGLHNIIKPRGPVINLEIFVTLRCHLSRAPRRVYKVWKGYLLSIKKFKRWDETPQKFNLQVFFKCSSAKLSRLPSTFSYRITENGEENSEEAENDMDIGHQDEHIDIGTYNTLAANY